MHTFCGFQSELYVNKSINAIQKLTVGLGYELLKLETTIIIIASK